MSLSAKKIWPRKGDGASTGAGDPLARLRQIARTRPAALLLFLTLLVRLAVPAGFMPVAAHGALLVVPCSGHGAMAMSGHGQAHPPKTDTGECPFSALGDAAGGGCIVAIAASIAALARPAIVPRPAPARLVAARLRPPGRAPPA